MKPNFRAIMNRHQNALKKLAEGPNGEYVHELEDRLKTVIRENDSLKKELERVKSNNTLLQNRLRRIIR